MIRDRVPDTHRSSGNSHVTDLDGPTGVTFFHADFLKTVAGA